jgi:DNA repair protein RadD
MLTLRPYQSEALAAAFRFWRAGGGDPLIDLATGTGKSVLIGELVRRLHATNSERRFLVLAHVRELIEQNIKALLTVWPEAQPLIGINSAGLGSRKTDAPIVFGTVQSCFRNPEALGRRNLLVVDEAHLIPTTDGSMYRGTITALRTIYPAMRVCGLTATPYRLDSGRLDQGDDRIFDRVVFSYGIGDAVADDWLAALVAKAPDGEINTTGVGKRGGEFIASELEAAADQADLVETDAREIAAYAGRRHAWLCFCCGVDHALHVRDALRRLGVSCETVTGTTPSTERREIFDAFRSGKILCLTGCNIFTTGFDIASVDLIAMLRPTGSPGLFVQMLGRGTRKAAGKRDCLVLDFSGNIMRHGPVDRVTGEDCDDQERGPGGARAKICPNCTTLVAPTIKECPSCGYTWPAPEANHAATASSISPLGGKEMWLSVRHVDFGLHAKFGKPLSLRVDYSTDGGETFSDWLALEHSPGARWHAARKWRALGGRQPVPQTASEAFARCGELGTVADISVERDDEYWRVTGLRLRPRLTLVSGGGAV